MNLIATPPYESNSMSPRTAVFMKDLVAGAADVIAPVWPLKTFIAVNPLQGLESLPFEQAVLEAEQLRGAVSAPHAGRESVNRELIKWCTAYFDDGQATFAMPGRKSGLYAAFASLAEFDSRLNRIAQAAALLASLPTSADDAIALSLDQLRIPEPLRKEFLRQSLAALPGWAGFVKWKEQWQDPQEYAKRPATLVEFAAVRLILTCLLWPDARVEEIGETPLPSFVSEVKKNELQFRTTLLPQLQSRAQGMTSAERDPAEAQFVFCIDVRSEPFRRAIEAQGPYETLGFAGFFGLPVRIQGYDESHPHDSCPVLLKPRHTVCEHPTQSPNAPAVRRHDRGRSLLRLPTKFFQWLKYSFTTPFALVEMLGPWFGLHMVARTFFPTFAARLEKTAHTALMPPIPVEPSLDTISPVQQADYAEAALKLMGLTQNLAPLVILCGHGSTTTNNAYATALDCGACGGNHGGANARILVAILNCQQVRAVLSERGICIPAQTLFVAAEHDTTTDDVTLYPAALVTSQQQSRLDELRIVLSKTRTANAKSRAATFGLSITSDEQAIQETERRSQDWAEIRPEWGLARNAGFIVGPRKLTRGCDLEGRCFLHSYEWASDPDGKLLSMILTAPLVVGQWINSQYLFSTANNTAYGAGSKVTQNITGKIGVMQGNASDLMHGLPLQSVVAADGQPYHEPQRLLAVVYAPRSTLESVIRSQDVLKKLFCNGWVTLACIDPLDQQVSLLKNDLQWQMAI